MGCRTAEPGDMPSGAGVSRGCAVRRIADLMGGHHPEPTPETRGQQMPATIPCLWFDTQAEQAAQYYTSIFPNSTVGAVTRYGPDNPAGLPAGTVLTVDFTLDGRAFTGLNGGPMFPFTEAVSFQIMCADQAEIDHYWDALTADGGQESVCGWLKDRFGLSWQVVPTDWMALFTSGDAERAQRGFQAVMGMKKIIIADVMAAADAG
jgi:predicted 3-demethylubiquinone-9 3-methyltransferase (glyoxalase superfamily)